MTTNEPIPVWAGGQLVGYGVRVVGPDLEKVLSVHRAELKKSALAADDPNAIFDPCFRGEVPGLTLATVRPEVVSKSADPADPLSVFDSVMRPAFIGDRRR